MKAVIGQRAALRLLVPDIEALVKRFAFALDREIDDGSRAPADRSERPRGEVRPSLPIRCGPRASSARANRQSIEQPPRRFRFLRASVARAGRPGEVDGPRAGRAWGLFSPGTFGRDDVSLPHSRGVSGGTMMCRPPLYRSPSSPMEAGGEYNPWWCEDCCVRMRTEVSDRCPRADTRHRGQIAKSLICGLLRRPGFRHAS